jgi:predicted transcriptional regulator
MRPQTKLKGTRPASSSRTTIRAPLGNLPCLFAHQNSGLASVCQMISTPCRLCCRLMARPMLSPANLTQRSSPPRLATMEVHLEPDVKAKLTRLAAERGRDAETLAREAIERFVGYDEWFIRGVEKGLAQIDRGETLTHEEVGTRLERLLTEKQSRA